MNPVAYCAISSCSDKDWEVFSVILVVLILLGFGVLVLTTVETFIRNNLDKEDDMK